MVIRFYNFPAWWGFDYDQEINAQIAKTIFVDHKLVLIGPETSVGGMYVGPYFNYLIGIVFWLVSFNPAGTIIINFAISIITLVVIYLIGKRLFNQSVGLLATLVYGFSPFFISYDRVLWNPTPMPLVSIITVWALAIYFKEKSKKWLYLAVIFVGIACQLHLTAIFLAAFLAVNIFLKPKVWPITLFIVGLFLMPLIIFDFRHDFLNSRHFINFFFSGSGNLHPNLNIFWALKDVAIKTFGVLTPFIFAGVLFRPMLILGVIALVGFAFYPGTMPAQYFLFLLAPLTIALAWGLTKLPKLISALLLIIFVIFGGWQIFSEKPPDISLRHKQAVMTFIKSKASEKPVYVDTVIGPGLNTGFQYLYWANKIQIVPEDVALKKFKLVLPYYLDPYWGAYERFGSLGIKEK